MGRRLESSMNQGLEENLISIVVPVYNAEKFILETIECVINQSWQQWELVLVDDGSTDQSRTIMEKMAAVDSRIKVMHLTNSGAAEARNQGTKAARGRYLAFLDADDIWEPGKLQKELEFMKKHKAAFVFTGYEFADEQGCGNGRIVRVPETLSYKEALKNTTIFTSTVMFDVKILGKDALLMPKIKSEDTALWWRILRNGSLAYGLDENLVKYRRSGQSLSANKMEAIRRIWNLYRKAEGLSLAYSMYNFIFWAYRAVARRIS